MQDEEKWVYDEIQYSYDEFKKNQIEILKILENEAIDEYTLFLLQEKILGKQKEEA